MTQINLFNLVLMSSHKKQEGFQNVLNLFIFCMDQQSGLECRSLHERESTILYILNKQNPPVT